MENKRYHIIIASIVFAVLTWVSVNMRDEYTVVKHMPVVLENVKEGKALKYAIPRFVSVRFRGNGWSLVGLYLSPDVKYFIDVSSLGAEDFMITSRDLLEHIKLPVTLQPVDVKPDTLLLALDDYKEKRVPILPRIVLGWREGYGQVGPTRLSPESVLVGGSENIIRTVIAWPTLYKKYEDLRTAIDADIPLEEPSMYSIEIFDRQTRLQVNIQPFAEKTFTGIALTAQAVPTNREVIFIPPRMDIIARGGIDQLAKLTSGDFQASVNFQNLMQDSVEVITPDLTIPPEVKVISRKPERFQFIVRKRL
ncbi:MAG: hypothetical protein HYR76_02610 [Ignavibacteria bacterium]|nr:hypothetical protein [Ignavibacteria bacterium]MBI3765881.1 hypothetical protein [Ignavibacteriales bacterium]